MRKIFDPGDNRPVKQEEILQNSAYRSINKSPGPGCQNKLFQGFITGNAGNTQPCAFFVWLHNDTLFILDF
jgi:hypothetical protein